MNSALGALAGALSDCIAEAFVPEASIWLIAVLDTFTLCISALAMAFETVCFPERASQRGSPLYTGKGNKSRRAQEMIAFASRCSSFVTHTREPQKPRASLQQSSCLCLPVRPPPQRSSPLLSLLQ